LLGQSLHTNDLRVIPTSVARWGSRLPAAGGGFRGSANTAAVEKSEEQTRQRPDRFFGHRKAAFGDFPPKDNPEVARTDSPPQPPVFYCFFVRFVISFTQ